MNMKLAWIAQTISTLKLLCKKSSSKNVAPLKGKIYNIYVIEKHQIIQFQSSLRCLIDGFGYNVLENAINCIIQFLRNEIDYNEHDTCKILKKFIKW